MEIRLKTYVVTLHVLLNAADGHRLRVRRRQEHVPQLAVLIDHLLHHMAGRYLDGHRNGRRTTLRHHRNGCGTYTNENGNNSYQYR